MRFHWWFVNTGSGNGLVLLSNKPLHESDICYHLVSVGHNELTLFCWHRQYIPRNMHMVYALLWFVTNPIYPYLSQFASQAPGNFTGTCVAIWMKVSYESTKIYITQTKWNKTKACEFLIIQTNPQKLGDDFFVVFIVPLCCVSQVDNHLCDPLKKGWLTARCSWGQQGAHYI